MKSTWSSMRLFRAVGGASLLLPLGLLANFTMNIVLARLLSIEDYGLFSVVTTLASVLAIGTALGFATSMMRFIPEYQAKGDFGRMIGISIGSLMIVTGSAIVVTIFLLLLCLLLPEALGWSKGLVFTALLIVPLTIGVWREGAMRGLHRIAGAILPRQVLLPVILMALTLLVGLGTGAEVLITYFLALIGLELVGLLLFRGSIPKEARGATPVYDTRHWLRVSWPMGFSALVRFGLGRWDVLFVGAMVSMEAAGLYTAAAKLSLLVGLGLRIINLAVGPLIADAYHNSDIEAVRNLVLRSTILASLLGLPLLIAVLLYPVEIMSIYGENYMQSSIILQLLVIGQVANLVTGPTGLLLQMSGREKTIATYVLVAALGSLLGLAFVVPYYGAVGAAAVTAICTIILEWAIWQSARKILWS